MINKKDLYLKEELKEVINNILLSDIDNLLNNDIKELYLDIKDDSLNSEFEEILEDLETVKRISYISYMDFYMEDPGDEYLELINLKQAKIGACNNKHLNIIIKFINDLSDLIISNEFIYNGIDIDLLFKLRDTYKEVYFLN